jgi:CBS domain-containing protein
MVKVREVMKKFVVTAEPGINMAEAAKIMTSNRVGSIVLIDKDSKPVGIITNEDIVSVVSDGKNPKSVKAGGVKMRDFVSVSPEDTIVKVTKKMIKTGVKRLPVVDNKGKIVGIVSEKEIVLISPEMMNILSEKLKMRVEGVMPTEGTISGICERCEGYADDLNNVAGEWVCEDCRGS